MQVFLALFSLLAFLPGCFAVTSESSHASPKEYRSPYVSDNQKPAWVGRVSYWEENGSMYAIGVVPESEGYDFSIRLRISEMEGKESLLRANAVCRGVIIGGSPIQTWVSTDGTIYTLVRGKRIIPQEKCKP